MSVYWYIAPTPKPKSHRKPKRWRGFLEAIVKVRREPAADLWKGWTNLGWTLDEIQDTEDAEDASARQVPHWQDAVPYDPDLLPFFTTPDGDEKADMLTDYAGRLWGPDGADTVWVEAKPGTSIAVQAGDVVYTKDEWDNVKQFVDTLPKTITLTADKISPETLSLFFGTADWFPDPPIYARLKAETTEVVSDDYDAMALAAWRRRIDTRPPCGCGSRGPCYEHR